MSKEVQVKVAVLRRQALSCVYAEKARQGRIRRLSEAKQLAESLTDEKASKSAETTEAILKLRAEAAALEEELDACGGADLADEGSPSAHLAPPAAAKADAPAFRAGDGSISSSDIGERGGNGARWGGEAAAVAAEGGLASATALLAMSQNLVGMVGLDRDAARELAKPIFAVAAAATAAASGKRTVADEESAAAAAADANNNGGTRKRLRVAGSSSSSSSGGGTTEDIVSEGAVLEEKLARQRCHIRALVAQLSARGEVPCDTAGLDISMVGSGREACYTQSEPKLGRVTAIQSPASTYGCRSNIAGECI